MSRATKVPVSRAALMARINRKLAKGDQALKVSRSERVRQEYGEFYVIDTQRNQAIRAELDLEEFGRELGVLRAYEHAVGV